MSNVGRVLAVVIFVAFCNRAVPLSAQSDARQELSTNDDQASVFIRPVDMGQVIGQPAGPPPTPRHTGVKAMMKDLVSDVAHLPSTENLFWAGVGGGLALAVHPADDNVTDSLVNSDAAHNFFVLGKYLGELYTLLPVAVTVYTVGRAKDQPKVSHVGMDLIQSLLVSEALVQTLKYATQRERPDGSDKHSFPSGHAADTFAFATALERHLGWKGAVPAYIFSSYVGFDGRTDIDDIERIEMFGTSASSPVNGHSARRDFR
jgi:hypothetical protein